MDRAASDRGGARAGQVIRDPDRCPADDRRRADRAHLWQVVSPTGPCADASPSRSTSSGSWSGRRNRSTAGNRRSSRPLSISRTAQPVMTTRIDGFAS